MKSDIECLYCMLKQAFNAVKLATDDKKLQRLVIDRTMDLIRQADLDLSPAANSTPVFHLVSEMTGNDDPFRNDKKQSNRQAMNLIPHIKHLLHKTSRPLEMLLHLAVAGNVIDLGIGLDFDFKSDLHSLLEMPFALDHTDLFRKEIRPGRRLLYLGDNAGEIVFDKFLVEYLQSQGMIITFAVKYGPIINDATIEDAEMTGLTKRTHVIETGGNDIGIQFDNVSREFADAFEQADVILAKGHGHFESCNAIQKNIYFLLKAKCDVVAAELGVKRGDSVLANLSGNHTRISA